VSGTETGRQPFGPAYDGCPLCGGQGFAESHALAAHGLALRWDRCLRCTLVFQNPPLTPEAVRQLYTQSCYFEHAYHNYTDHDTLRLVQSNARLDRIERTTKRAGGRLLDVGSASGFFGAAARERGYTVTCIEPDEAMAAYGREHYGLDIRACPLEACQDIPAESFDLVTLWGTDSHFAHAVEGFERLAELLRPGGFLAMNYQDFSHPIRRILPGIKVAWNALFNLSDASFAKLMDRIGLVVVERVATEWQVATADHICRVIRLPAPRFAERIRLSVPAVSFRWVLARKPERPVR
jgi:SAM-dependent methyltransferase